MFFFSLSCPFIGYVSPRITGPPLPRHLLIAKPKELPANKKAQALQRGALQPNIKIQL